MDLVQGGGNNKICGCVPGDVVSLYLITGHAERIVLSKIDRIGVEGYHIDLLERPLTFYPFTNILKIKKYTETL